MKSLLGMHWLKYHQEGRDLEHIERMQYPSIKVFEWHWSNRDACNDLLVVLPRDSYILARDQPLSEQKEGMWSNPEGHGIYHANEWAKKVAMGQYHLPVERTFFLGINEPDATNGDRNAIDIYTAAFLDRLTVHGLRGGAFNFSTGHPRTVDGTGGSKADYSVFERSHGAILRGHHIGVLHIYGTGAVPCAPGHYDRLEACTWQDVEWVVGEFGVDEHVIGGGPHLGFHHYFNGRLHDYCAWLDTAIMGISDPRIHSYQVFTYDYSHPWSGFDVSVIGDALEGYDWQHVKQPPALPPIPQPAPPLDVLLPFVPGSGAQPVATVVYVGVPAGVNLRASPGGDLLTAVPFRDTVELLGFAAGANNQQWVRVRYGDTMGWIRNDLLLLAPPESEKNSHPWPLPEPTQPAPVASEIIEPLVLEAILQVESGGQGFGSDGSLLVRFEAHIFKTYLPHDEPIWKAYFRTDSERPWINQEWRKSATASWQQIHTGNQADEYAAFDFARGLYDPEGAYKSISMGAAQIMGFNHARVGYPRAEAMYKAFSRSLNAQLIGMVNYMLSDPDLAAAVKRKDWEAIARGYNGGGNVAEAAAKYRAAYEKLGGG